nr:MAG TPA: hypothetical protein [Caudoviricetes sp.]
MLNWRRIASILYIVESVIGSCRFNPYRLY